MTDDKKNIPEAAPPTEAPAPAVENAVVPEQPAPQPALTDAEAVILELLEAEEDNEEDMLQGVEDEEILNAVFNLFMEKNADEFQFEQ